MRGVGLIWCFIKGQLSPLDACSNPFLRLLAKEARLKSH